MQVSNDSLKLKQELEAAGLYMAGSYDVIVVGAGHAGIEAAYAAAKLVPKVLLFTLSLDALANMPCNPHIGGTAKGQLVREIDALGGLMGEAADAAGIHFRMLNTSKGKAVHSPRAQIDRKAYHRYMKERLEKVANLELRQAEICDFLYSDDGNGKKQIVGVISRYRGAFLADKVVVCAGTYLNAEIIVGQNKYACGPDSLSYSQFLSAGIAALGLRMQRFKTGTPVRIHRRSVDFTGMEVQAGDETCFNFSYLHDDEYSDYKRELFATANSKQLADKSTAAAFKLYGAYGLLQAAQEYKHPLIETGQQHCYVAYTNSETHRIINDNIDRSPLFSGLISGTGTRYCPSIEDKVVKFSEKERHQLFIEPTGLDTEELYISGLSSSLPEDVQVELLHSIQGLETAEITRTAYAIEYDLIDPQELDLSLQSKSVAGLYFAGQMNGSSGYEEAACQGLIAGANAALSHNGQTPLTLRRDQAYIGVLIDDLVTRGTAEPYRMMTSRTEYRLSLRQDNADERLSKIAYDSGLISEERYQAYLLKAEKIAAESARLEKVMISPEQAHEYLSSLTLPDLVQTFSLAELFKRPQFTYETTVAMDSGRPQDLSAEVMFACETAIKYAGYIKIEKERIKRFNKLESRPLPPDFDYNELKGLRLEARQKLNKYKPLNLGQAGRISGVSPADISVLIVYFDSYRKNRKSTATGDDKE